jgi:lysozyme
METDMEWLAIVLCCAREGIRETVYLDHLGKPTAGIGHLLTEEERKKYRVGEKIPMEIISDWYQKDLLKALGAARAQANEIGAESEFFIAALASVNFQLGTAWYKIHKKTWRLLTEQNWQEAAKEVTKSVWYKQTPNRVEDFQRAILSLNQ